mgnify:CR=1 FL=1
MFSKDFSSKGWNAQRIIEFENMTKIAEIAQFDQIFKFNYLSTISTFWTEIFAKHLYLGFLVSAVLDFAIYSILQTSKYNLVDTLICKFFWKFSNIWFWSDCQVKKNTLWYHFLAFSFGHSKNNPKLLRLKGVLIE